MTRNERDGDLHEELISEVRAIYGEEGFLPLHRPVFEGAEKAYLTDCPISTPLWAWPRWSACRTSWPPSAS